MKRTSNEKNLKWKELQMKRISNDEKNFKLKKFLAEKIFRLKIWQMKKKFFAIVSELLGKADLSHKKHNLQPPSKWKKRKVFLIFTAFFGGLGVFFRRFRYSIRLYHKRQILSRAFFSSLRIFPFFQTKLEIRLHFRQISLFFDVHREENQRIF